MSEPAGEAKLHAQHDAVMGVLCERNRGVGNGIKMSTIKPY